MSSNKFTRPLTLRLTHDVFNKLKLLADDKQINIQSYIREMIRKEVNKFE